MQTHQAVLKADHDIVREYVSGDAEFAASLFVQKYRRFVYAIALRRLNDSDEAEDAAQIALIKALDGLHKFRSDSSIKTWIYRITVNVCSNMQRKKRATPFSFFQTPEPSFDFEIPDVEPNPLQQVANKDTFAILQTILQQLPEKQRETFALRYFDELTYEEMSEILGTSVGGLKANYFHAIQKIAEMLPKYGIVGKKGKESHE